MLNRHLRQSLLISCLVTILTACGGGGGGSGGNDSGKNGSDSSSSRAPSQTTSSPVALSESRELQLSWTVPATRTDGSALPITAIKEYRLYYMREGSSASEDTVVTINGGNTTNSELTLAIAGTYTFAITAVDTDNAESPLSTPVSITVN